ncbi:helix-turn-helix domain-containing protein [Bradyrhizobium guangzhouense]|uniref:HTH lysR-type domain-containing protein n=1 Tax=Bradyrhizobium guangzhouense TaxID=1325095 RepID=A0AAE5WXL8_9BRAD|nr:LysR family transcriptional regulator [Bradyrhizobium guangzhouense]QAU44780.1 hypothetical protein XH91_05060 [Bradyrhizobium guangzhouense]
MPTTLDLDTLRALLAIVELKSFSRAAERLGRSQSAISLQIARLEAVVGHPPAGAGPRPDARTDREGCRTYRACAGDDRAQ